MKVFASSRAGKLVLLLAIAIGDPGCGRDTAPADPFRLGKTLRTEPTAPAVRFLYPAQKTTLKPEERFRMDVALSLADGQSLPNALTGAIYLESNPDAKSQFLFKPKALEGSNYLLTTRMIAPKKSGHFRLTVTSEYVIYVPGDPSRGIPSRFDRREFKGCETMIEVSP